jgi:hypothetical protein
MAEDDSDDRGREQDQTKDARDQTPERFSAGRASLG